MLNRRTQLKADDATKTDAHGEAQWRCPRGHVTTVWLRFNGEAAFGGSAWDFCDHCSAHPNPVQDTRMHLEIFSRWLDTRAINISQYRTLTSSIMNTEYTPAHVANPVAALGLPSWPRIQPTIKEG